MPDGVRDLSMMVSEAFAESGVMLLGYDLRYHAHV